MTTSTRPNTEKRTASLASQARQLSEHYPELYDHLRRRDKAIERALRRIPSRADVELSSVFRPRRHLEKALRELPPGIGDLNGHTVQDSDPNLRLTDEGIIDG